MLSAIILIKPKKSDTINYFKQILDIKKIENKTWFIPIIFLMPAIATISYFSAYPLPDNFNLSNYPFISIIVFLSIYFIGAIGEELGWSGYASEPLQIKYGSLKASLILGVVWAIWHIIPYVEMGKPARWILFQCLSTVLLRIVMFWIFNNTNKSIFAMILFHSMINLSPYLLSVHYVNYNPSILLASLIICTVTIVLFRRTDDFSRSRFAKG